MFLFLIVLFILTFDHLDAQVSIYQEKSNSAAEIIKLPEGMTYDEFIKIQRHVDWSKVIISSIVPGFIHFYAEQEKRGWFIVGIRTLGYGLMGYAIVDQYKLINDDRLRISILDKKNRQNQNAIIFSVGSLLNIFGFFYDWADGILSIEEDRNKIYFKYGTEKMQKIKLGFSTDKNTNSSFINILLQL